MKKENINNKNESGLNVYTKLQEVKKEYEKTLCFNCEFFRDILQLMELQKKQNGKRTYKRNKNK